MMDPAIRQITRMPLNEVWDDSGVCPHRRLRSIGIHEIHDLLSHGQIRIVVADCGTKPHWVPSQEIWTFWKQDMKPHIADQSLRIRLEDFPGGYCYLASEWGGHGLSPIIVLEKLH